MSSMLWQTIIWGLIWTTVGSAMLALTQWLTRYITNAAVRHSAWTGAFACVALFPFFGATTMWREWTSAVQCAPDGPPGIWRPTLSDSLGYLLVGGWFAGTVSTLGRALLGRWMVNGWRTQGRDYRQEISRLSGTSLPIDFLQNVELRLAVGDNPQVPITWGVKKPVVLLPRSAEEWGPSRLTAVLLHEWGHIRRYDNLTQFVVLMTCAIHWFNPLFWYSARRMEAESEIAADDFAILRGMKPSNYAKELLDLASQIAAKPATFTFAQTAMVKLFTLEYRLHSIIDSNARRGPINCSSLIGIMGVLIGVMLAITFLTPRLSSSLSSKTVVAPNCLSTSL